MSVRNAGFISAGIEDVERILRRMQEEANRPDAAASYGVDQKTVNRIKNAVESIGEDVGRLHRLLGNASQRSTVPGIAGLGQKPD